jgi:hypothetical protein
MRRSWRLGVESLEGKLLLSGATSGLSASLVATPTTTSAGTSVALTFTETNVSDQEITVTYGPVDDGFTASSGGKSVWVSNSGFEPQYLMLKRLEPEQSITVDGTWDGHSNVGLTGGSSQEGPALNGNFKVSNQLDSAATTLVSIGEQTTHVVPPRPTHRFQ